MSEVSVTNHVGLVALRVERLPGTGCNVSSLAPGASLGPQMVASSADLGKSDKLTETRAGAPVATRQAVKPSALPPRAG